MFRALLRADPGDLNLRRELGYTLILAEKFASAQFHFEILLREAETPQDRVLYAQVLRRIAQDRPFGLSAHFSITPSSNLNGGSKHEEFQGLFGVGQITESSQAISGFQRQFGLSGYVRHPLNDSHNLRLDWRVLRTDYSVATLSRVDEAGVHASWHSVGPSRRLSRTLSRTRRHTADDLRLRDSFRLGGWHKLSAQTAWEWSATATQNTYAQASDRDGMAYRLTARQIFSGGGGQNIWFGGQFERDQTGRSHQAYDGPIAQLGARRILFGGTETSLTYSLGRRTFSDLFPGVAMARKDRFHELTLIVQDSRVQGFGVTPQLTCTLRRNHSNISLFDSTTQACGVALTRRF